MPNILIRNLTDAQIAGIDNLARQAATSRQEFLLDHIAGLVGGFDPEIVLGFIYLTGGDRPGNSECDCGQPFSEAGIYIGFTGDLRPFGPQCGFCAEIGEPVIEVRPKRS
jgi:hypothetical protein